MAKIVTFLMSTAVTTLVLLYAQAIQAKELALAFDGTLAGTTSLDGMARSQMLVRNMIKVGVNQAMFLVHTQNINAKNRNRVMLYDDGGQLIVNEGHKHWLLSRPDVYRYQVDIMRANAELVPYLHYQQHVNFPFLYEGRNTAALKQLHRFLSEYGYQPTYTTYKAQDDYIDQLYQARIADNKFVDIRRLEKAYVNYIVDGLTAYDNQAHVMLGFSPPQVLLLHENDLAAYFIAALVDALNARGWKIVDPEKIFSNPIANPYLVGGFSGVGYMQSITGLPDQPYDESYVISPAERERVRHHLNKQQLDESLSVILPAEVK